MSRHHSMRAEENVASDDENNDDEGEKKDIRDVTVVKFDLLERW